MNVLSFTQGDGIDVQNTRSGTNKVSMVSIVKLEHEQVTSRSRFQIPGQARAPIDFFFGYSQTGHTQRLKHSRVTEHQSTGRESGHIAIYPQPAAHTNTKRDRPHIWWQEIGQKSIIIKECDVFMEAWKALIPFYNVQYSSLQKQSLVKK